MVQPEIRCLTNGSFAENCYLIADPDTGDAVIVDPGEEPVLFLRRMQTEGWRATAIWLTHAHVDHVAGVAHIVRETGVPVYLHPDDRELYDNVAVQASWLGVSVEPPPPPNFELTAGDTISVGSCSFSVRHVPGHSPGSVAFIGDGLTIVGDALFAGSVGRVDLPGGDGPTLLRSIQEQLMTLSEDTVVHPGHGPATTIGHEKATNPFLIGVYPLI